MLEVSLLDAEDSVSAAGSNQSLAENASGVLEIMATMTLKLTSRPQTPNSIAVRLMIYAYGVGWAR